MDICIKCNKQYFDFFNNNLCSEKCSNNFYIDKLLLFYKSNLFPLDIIFNMWRTFRQYFEAIIWIETSYARPKRIKFKLPSWSYLKDLYDIFNKQHACMCKDINNPFYFYNGLSRPFNFDQPILYQLNRKHIIRISHGNWGYDDSLPKQLSINISKSLGYLIKSIKNKNIKDICLYATDCNNIKILDYYRNEKYDDKIIIRALYNDKIDVIKYYVKKKCYIDVDKNYYLGYAIKYCSYKCIKYLLDINYLTLDELQMIYDILIIKPKYYNTYSWLYNNFLKNEIVSL